MSESTHKPAAPSLSSKTPVVEVCQVSTHFGETVVHEEIDLTVYRGELFAIVGGSGSGKTVLLREMILLQEPDAGSIRLFGEEGSWLTRSGRRALRRRCGVLFQQGALFSSLTIAENVALPFREYTRLSKGLIREMAALKIALVGLPPESAARYPNTLSGGMRKRAALARAIALDPELLFLDEPTAGLDPISAGGLDDLIRNLKEWLGLTIVMVTHDLDTLWRIADRVAVLGEGSIRGSGTMTELSQAEDPLIRAFFHGPRSRAAKEQAGKESAWNRR